MEKMMKKAVIAVPLLAFAALATTQVSMAQAPGAAEVIYTPVKMIADQSLTVKGWGSGSIAESDDAAYEGAHSIRFSSRNFFQGGIITLGKTVDLAKAYTDKNNLLRLVYRTADSSTVIGGGRGGVGGGGGFGGAGLGGPPPGVPGGAGQGGAGQGGAFGGAGLGGPPAATRGGAGAATKLKTIRVIVTTTDGKKSETYVPVNTSSGTGERGWRSVAVPLQAISGFERTNKTVQSVAFSTDVSAVVYLGDLRVINDSTPVRGEPNVRSINRELGAEVVFSATGQGGTSVLKYTWDFDDSDGVEVDAEGQVVKHKFRRPGTYTITLTISDYFGLKAPFKTTIKAKINP